MAITKEEALQFLNENPEEILDHFEVEKVRRGLENDSRRAELFQIEKSEIIGMRADWSKFILIAIIAIIAFDFIIITLIGLDIMTFNGLIIPAFLTESLFKVIGLAYIIVRFLFSKDSKG